MSAIAYRRLEYAGLSNTLVRASVYRLPFPDRAFEVLISTFPTEFIFAPPMLHEAWRVLSAGGRLVVVPTARPRHPGPFSPAVIAWQRITHLSDADSATIQDRFQQAGFTFEEHHVAKRRADVIVWVCGKQ